MAVVCAGITAYDLRVSVKGVSGEALTYGESVYIAADGLIYAVDNGKNDVCHGWVLKTCAAGVTVTVVNKCRMRSETAQTPGQRAFTGAVAGGSAPSTTLAAGVVVGYAITTDLLMLEAQMPPPADG